MLVDRRVAEAGEAVIGSGLRHSKILVTGEVIASLRGAEMPELNR